MSVQWRVLFVVKIFERLPNAVKTRMVYVVDTVFVQIPSSFPARFLVLCVFDTVECFKQQPNRRPFGGYGSGGRPLRLCS